MEEAEPVFDLVGVAEAEGWDQTELMFFLCSSMGWRTGSRSVVSTTR